MSARRFMIVILILISSTPAYAVEPPAWTKEAQRQVSGGDIIQWGTGQAQTSEVALFKARHMAIKALIDECGGVAHKEIFPRKQYIQESPKGFVAFATASLDFGSCEQAKQGYLKNLENPKLVEGQKLYKEMLRTESMPRIKSVEFSDAVAKKISAFLKDQVEANNHSVAVLEQEVANLKLDIMKQQQELAHLAAEPARRRIQDREEQKIELSDPKQSARDCWAIYQELESAYARACAEKKGTHHNPCDDPWNKQLSALMKKSNECETMGPRYPDSAGAQFNDYGLWNPTKGPAPDPYRGF